MSIEHMAVVLHHSRAEGAGKLVLLGIANHEGDGGSWPAVATLARYANITPRNVQKHISALVALGELHRDVMEGGTRQTPDHTRPNLYRVLVTCPDNCDKTPQHRLTKPLSETTPPVASDTPPPVGDDTPPLSPATPEPSLNQPLNPESALNVVSPTRERESSAQELPAQPAAQPVANDATGRNPFALSPEQMERNKRGAALAKAALRGQPVVELIGAPRSIEQRQGA